MELQQMCERCVAEYRAKMGTAPRLTEKEVLDLINDTRVVLNKRVDAAKKARSPDDQLAELDDRLLDLQERIMNEGIAPSPKQ
jgi:hypothetical protein